MKCAVTVLPVFDPFAVHHEPDVDCVVAVEPPVGVLAAAELVAVVVVITIELVAVVGTAEAAPAR